MSNGGGKGIANFRNVEKLKIWLALADDYEGEPATAQAAMGALATAAADEGETRLLIISHTQTQMELVSCQWTQPLSLAVCWRHRRERGSHG
jgi:hypothetical protein